MVETRDNCRRLYHMSGRDPAYQNRCDCGCYVECKLGMTDGR